MASTIASSSLALRSAAQSASVGNKQSSVRVVARAAPAPSRAHFSAGSASHKQQHGAAARRSVCRMSTESAPAPEPAAAPEESKKDLPVVLGVTLPANRNAQFLILASGALVCSLGFAALQEGVFRVPGFKFAGWMTLITSVVYAVCGFVENALMNGGKIVRNASWKNYWLLSVLTFGGMYLTNYALKFLAYATRIVFKSAKVVPVMIFATVINGKKFSAAEYLSVAVLVAGIILFTLGDVAGVPTFNPIGVVLILIALCVDAICSNFEEKNFFRVENPSSQAEVLGFASLIGSLYAFLALLPSGELGPALAHSMANPQVVPMICVFSVLGYVSVTFVLSLIKYFGATETEIVKSLRKVLSICLSFILFPKVLNWKYIAGFFMVVTSTLMTFKIKTDKAKKKAALKAA